MTNKTSPKPNITKLDRDTYDKLIAPHRDQIEMINDQIYELRVELREATKMMEEGLNEAGAASDLPAIGTLVVKPGRARESAFRSRTNARYYRVIGYAIRLPEDVLPERVWKEMKGIAPIQLGIKVQRCNKDGSSGTSREVDTFFNYSEYEIPYA